VLQCIQGADVLLVCIADAVAPDANGNTAAGGQGLAPAQSDASEFLDPTATAHQDLELTRRNLPGQAPAGVMRLQQPWWQVDASVNASAGQHLRLTCLLSDRIVFYVSGLPQTVLA
jgi:hypothetical protein